MSHDQSTFDSFTTASRIDSASTDGREPAPDDTSPNGDYCVADHDRSLDAAQRTHLQHWVEAAADLSADGNTVTAIGTLAIADRIRELILLRKHRNAAVMDYGDRKTAAALNAAIDDLLRDLKRGHLPHHPVFCSQADWDRLGIPRAKATDTERADPDTEILDPGVVAYDWDQYDL